MKTSAYISSAIEALVDAHRLVVALEDSISRLSDTFHVQARELDKDTWLFRDDMEQFQKEEAEDRSP